LPRVGSSSTIRMRIACPLLRRAGGVHHERT